MKSYIMSVAVTSVISAVMNIITPEKWSKYVGMVTGLVITICISGPIISFMNADMFVEIGEVSSKVTAESENILKEEVQSELEKRIEEDIESRLKSEFALNVTANAEMSANEKGEISGVRRIVLQGDKPDAVVMGRIYEVYEAEEVKYAGTEKTLEKRE